MSISVLNFSIALAKELTLYDLLFLIAIDSPNNDNKRPSEMRNYHHNSHFTITEVFLSCGLNLTIVL